MKYLFLLFICLVVNTSPASISQYTKLFSTASRKLTESSHILGVINKIKLSAGDEIVFISELEKAGAPAGFMRFRALTEGHVKLEQAIHEGIYETIENADKSIPDSWLKGVSYSSDFTDDGAMLFSVRFADGMNEPQISLVRQLVRRIQSRFQSLNGAVQGSGGL